MNAQNLQGEKSATHFFIVNFDENLYDVLTSAKADKKSADANGKEFIASIIDTFYSIATEKLKSEIGLELLPLNELHDKIKYNKEYPNCPDMDNIKKVLKSASGYKFYMDYYINVFSDLNSDLTINLSPSKIRPLYAIRFVLYDGLGKPVEKIDFSYKSKKPLADGNKQVNRTGQQLKLRLCDFYNEALDGFSIVCRKKLTSRL